MPRRQVGVIVAVTAALVGFAGLTVGRTTATGTTQVVAAPAPVTAPLRPTYQDVSLKVIGQQDPLKFFRGKVATQTQRDAMQQSLLGVYLPEAWRWMTQVSTCSQVANQLASEMTKTTAKLGPAYEAKDMRSSGGWFVPPQGRNYNMEQAMLRRIQACALSGSGVVCGTTTGMHAGLADLLDIRVDDFTKRCIKGAQFVPPPQSEPFNTTRAALGKARPRPIPALPPLTVHQLELLRKTHSAHMMSSDVRCATRLADGVPSVQGAHLALEATAVSEDQHHFLRMKDFSGAPDGAWDARSACQIARIQDVAHGSWMDAVIRLDWRAARQFDSDHQLAHIMLGMRTERLKFLFSCGPAKVEGCPIQTASEVLAKA